ncbi:MAG: DNA repair protein RecO, partial [Ketobacter sp.]
QHSFSGQHLLAIEQHDYDEPEVAKAAKRLIRLALAPHLGDKPLHSRELFKQLTP